MLKNTKYSVTFPSNGITLTGDFSLEPGATAITGPNGSGKTFGSLEIWRYLLFGKEALRGPAVDYKTLVAEGTCTIAGQDYTISRSAKKETLVNAAGEVLAVNASAVTQKVKELLGFNLAVFDVVCCAVQKDKSGFSDLLPTARKKLIDDIVGLSSQEAVEKDCKEEAKKHRMTASVLLDGHSKPQEPVTPKDYLPSSDIEAALVVAREYETAKGKLMAAEAAPVEPKCARPTAEFIGSLQIAVDDTREHTRLMKEHGELKVPQYSKEIIDAAEAYNEVISRGPRPKHSLSMLEHQEKIWTFIEIGDTEVECPDCGSKFTPGQSYTADLTKAEIAAERRAHLKWETDLPEVAAPEVELTAKQIRDAREEHVAYARADQLMVAAALCDINPEAEALLKAAGEDEAEWKVYDVLLNAWNNRERIRLENQEAFDAIAVPEQGTETLQARLVASKVYETELTNYTAQLEEYTLRNDRILEADGKAKDYTEGAKALSETRMAIKAFLAPSLSRVASSLISEMTAGKLDTVIVDEEMNVTVNGQDISTLSGAGTTVANLALRIALGQVLVSKVFSVFIGDELDKDMDFERSAATAEALARLSGQLDQLVLITHKEVSFADHQIIHTNP